MLILRQKSFQFCIPHLKTSQPVLPYFTAYCPKISTVPFHFQFDDIPVQNHKNKLIVVQSNNPSQNHIQNHLLKYIGIYLFQTNLDLVFQ